MKWTRFVRIQNPYLASCPAVVNIITDAAIINYALIANRIKEIQILAVSFLIYLAIPNMLQVCAAVIIP